ncbi:flagellar biosynthesis protein FlgF [Rhodanobacter sp. Root480]|uniref:Flagellar basal-body rod protein FlgF n=1 Tax=Rhodanobacter ginsenosidimutans TaxID=490571 RepID=A0ABW0JY04_9GAMM|nr:MULTISPECIES: flagellar basal-body rod protein FlgF [unclassified Rhodanobacter]KQX95154.1 flagellar biosynthesis protein FlgF [Rhodanobacter sp. Root480]KRA30152.1 flagellar biosynthesis protein FlgF [Rhodanobacter sp. Root627]
MDHSLYVAMTGATQMMRAQSEVAHNLANADTVGFKAQMSAFQPLAVQGQGLPTRVNGVAYGQGVDMRQGGQIDTGRELDVAVQGEGWIAVQAPDGSEAYTRAGSLQLTADGLLTDDRGNPVMGDGGPITVPQSTQMSIGADGTLSVVPMGQTPETIAAVGRLKLVNPGVDQLQQGTDGLMHLVGGGNAPADPAVTLKSGALESSNVNPSETLVQMIQLSRQYELQIRSIKSADENAQSASRLLQMA